MPTKVTMIIPTLVQGGAEKQMSLLAVGLPRAEFEVSVVALTSGGPWQSFLEQHGLSVTVIGKRFKLDPLSFYRLYRHLKNNRPDLIHTWIFAANAYGRMAGMLAGVKTRIVGERCVDLWKSEYHFAVDRFLDRFTTAYVTNSGGVVDFYQKHRVGVNKFHVVPNGFQGPGAGDPDARQKWRERLAVPPESFLLTSLARLWPQKRLKDLIWATDLISCQYDHVHLVVAGDGPERERLEQFAHEAKVADRVHFVGHVEDPTSLLQATDLFCLVSEYEGQSNALMEAMACQVPAVVTDIPGNRDLIPDTEYGFVCQVGDRVGIAKQIAAALANVAGAQQRARRAAEHLRGNFSLDVMIQRYGELYRKLSADSQVGSIGET